MSSPQTGPSTKGLHILYIPVVCLIIAFQGYFSQYLFATSPDLEPGPLTRRQSITFNVLLLILWWTYYQACTIDPGRFVFPASSAAAEADPSLRPSSTPNEAAGAQKRWCKKCSLPKPPRAHHCRHCGRCIPKMDHHCPWTGNCVSLQTFPYFLRFLVYTVLTLFYLLHLLSLRLSAIWASRSLPSYLGPSVSSLISVTLLTLSSLTTIFLLSILTFTTLKSALFNTTLIEDWEIERHESAMSRIDPYESASSEFWSAEDAAGAGDQLLSRIEFPYDLGFFKNLSQAMGTSNPIRWVLPVFGGGPRLAADKSQRGVGWEYEENGFNDLPGLWPPPDPEKARQAKRGGWPGAEARIREEEVAMIYDSNSIYGGQEDIKAAFARRQKEDMERRRRAKMLESQSRGGIIAELEEDEEEEEEREGYEFVSKSEWKNSEGERLRDFGVDEEAEEETVGVDDDVPLAELLRRRRAVARQDEE